MRKRNILCLILISFLTLSACSKAKNDDPFGFKDSSSSKQSSSNSSSEKALKKEYAKALKATKDKFPQLTDSVTNDEAQVVLKTSKGDITMTLFPKYAPLASENFLKHAKDGYYNGLSFHRIIKDFMIQTGDPNGDGTGGESIWNGKNSKIDSGQGFKNEISPYLYNIRGALAMANTSAPSTNGSQFYINQNSQDQSKNLSTDSFPKPIIDAYKKGGNPSLDGGYTVFGQVTKGMDVVDSIASVEVDSADKPKDDIKINSVEIVKDYTFKDKN